MSWHYFFQDIPSGTLMFWKGFISIFCGFLFLSFDKGSQIFIQKDIDSTAIGKLFLLASIDITATWIATGPWKFIIIHCNPGFRGRMGRKSKDQCLQISTKYTFLYSKWRITYSLYYMTLSIIRRTKIHVIRLNKTEETFIPSCRTSLLE